MKIIITERQLAEIAIFNREAVNSDKITKLIENVVLEYIDFSICDMVVTKNDKYDMYIVLIVVPNGSSGMYKDEKITDYVKKYIPVDVLVLISDSECDDFIN